MRRERAIYGGTRLWCAAFKLLLPALVVLGCLLSSRDAFASHFRHGQISWLVPDPVGAPRTVTFTVTTTWRAANVGSTNLQFGDATNNGNQGGVTIGTGSDSTGAAYTVREYSATHTYASNGPFTAFFEGCCRITGGAMGLQNGANSNYRVEAVVDLNASNSAPGLIASSFLIPGQIGGVRTFTFLMADADGESPTCRFGTSAESGLPAGQEIPTAGGQQPTLASTPGVCTLTWDLTGATAGNKFALHLVSETTRGGGTSSAQIDLMMEMVSTAPPTCAGSGSFSLTSGVAFSQVLTGSDGAAGNLQLLGIGLPATATLTPASGTNGPSPYATTLAWTPAAGDRGTSRIVIANFRNTTTNLTGNCQVVLTVAPCATACAGATPICALTGPNAGTCVACTASAQCGSAAAPVCSATTNTCVPCASDFGGATNACPLATAPACTGGMCQQCSAANLTQCGGATPACSPAGACVQCSAADASQCAGATPVCNTTTSTCVQCTAANAAACTGNTPACNTATSTCGSCTVNPAVCAGATPDCKAATGACVQCTASTSCAGTTPVCNTATNVCAACDGDMGAATASTCPAAASPFCRADGACAKCTDNGNGVTGCRNAAPAHGPYCEPVSGACGTGCLVDAECAATQFCGTASGVCVPKAANGQPLPAAVPVGGVCSIATAPRGCVSAQCDTTNGLCGLTNSKACVGDVCQSGVCFTDTKCGKPNGQSCADLAVCRSAVCFGDGSCGLPTNETCGSSGECRNSACVAADGPRCGKLNGAPCAAAPECRSGICNADGGCGDPNGTACTTPGTCRSGVCNAGVCSGECATDAQCPSPFFCDASNKRCVRDYPNGGPTAPLTCTRAAQCESGVCGADNACGDPDSAACTVGTTCRSGGCVTGKCTITCTIDAECAATHFCDDASKKCVLDKANGIACARKSACISGICNADGSCGQPTGQPCGGAVQCRSDLCDATGTCATACTADPQCAQGKFCDAGACVAVRPNNQPCARASQCVSGDCNADGKCGEPDGAACGASELCRSGLCTKDGKCGGCATDTDCGNAQSGKVCDDSTRACVPGCRAGGNGCPTGLTCNATAAKPIGECVPTTTGDAGAGADGGTGSGAGDGGAGSGAAAVDGVLGGGGFSCSVGSAGGGAGLSLFGVFLAAGVGLARRRRRRR